jgi:class 3 adenylate cyclase
VIETHTFLFTDLEVSARLWGRQPQEKRAALHRHNEIIRSAVEVHSGPFKRAPFRQ